MSEKYGFPVDLWEEAKEEMRDILVATARAKQTIPYSALVSRIHTITLQADSHALAAILGEISTEEDAAGRGMLSVVVVHKSGDMRPGPGFFELAQKLGRMATDKDKLWVEELNRVYSAF